MKMQKINIKEKEDIKGKIVAKDLVKNFKNGLSIFENISFNVNAGEIVSILGPSGSGKTTLLRCIIGLDNDFSGEINIDNLPNAEYLKKKRIAFVLQKYSNFSWLTVYDNIASAFQYKKMTKLQKKGRINTILKEVDLLGFENYFPNQLSGGMQQRVAVARALVQDTDIIALDEPFGALDMRIRENLQLLTKEINLNYKKTILFVTHDIEEAIFLSDKIIVFSKLPLKSLKIYKDILSFKQDYDTSAKYRPKFTEIRQEIEEYISNY